MKIAVVGANGRMGQEVLSVITSNYSGHIDAIGIVRKGRAKGYSESSNSLHSLSTKPTVVIDFSLPESQKDVFSFCEKRKVPLVSGVTGYTDDQMRKIENLAKKTPILWSANMSLGIALLKKALRDLGDIRDFDLQLVEWHHRHKKDRPSGTAKTLQESLDKSIARSLPDPISIRGGGIVGIHKIYIMGDEETISFEHQALSRRVFASGAVKAALWIAGRSPGLYSMDDVLLQSKNERRKK